jgi:hypothetical protein
VVSAGHENFPISGTTFIHVLQMYNYCRKSTDNGLRSDVSSGSAFFFFFFLISFVFEIFSRGFCTCAVQILYMYKFQLDYVNHQF